MIFPVALSLLLSAMKAPKHQEPGYVRDYRLPQPHEQPERLPACFLMVKYSRPIARAVGRYS